MHLETLHIELDLEEPVYPTLSWGNLWDRPWYVGRPSFLETEEPQGYDPRVQRWCRGPEVSMTALPMFETATATICSLSGVDDPLGVSRSKRVPDDNPGKWRGPTIA